MYNQTRLYVSTSAEDLEKQIEEVRPTKSQIVSMQYKPLVKPDGSVLFTVLVVYDR
jgi:hypothetical protein